MATVKWIALQVEWKENIEKTSDIYRTRRAIQHERCWQEFSLTRMVTNTWVKTKGTYLKVRGQFFGRNTHRRYGGLPTVKNKAASQWSSREFAVNEYPKSLVVGYLDAVHYTGNFSYMISTCKCQIQ